MQCLTCNCHWQGKPAAVAGFVLPTSLNAAHMCMHAPCRRFMIHHTERSDLLHPSWQWGWFQKVSPPAAQANMYLQNVLEIIFTCGAFSHVCRQVQTLQKAPRGPRHVKGLDVDPPPPGALKVSHQLSLTTLGYIKL